LNIGLNFLELKVPTKANKKLLFYQ